MIEGSLELLNTTRRSAKTIDADAVESVQFDRFATFLEDARHVDVVSIHLFSQVDSERRIDAVR